MAMMLRVRAVRSLVARASPVSWLLALRVMTRAMMPRIMLMPKPKATILMTEKMIDPVTPGWLPLDELAWAGPAAGRLGDGPGI